MSGEADFDEDLPTMVKECERCAEHWDANGWSIIGACASVGIEHGKSTWQMAKDYFEGYHRRGHK